MMDNWMTALVETYDVCTKDPSTRSGDVPLVPIYHTLINAHITVTIDGEGNFIRAEAVPKGQQNTLIPCTESSAGRTSAPCPHPLDDKLVYLIPDLGSHLKDGIGRAFQSSYDMYVCQLKEWCNSDYRNRKAEAVLRYIEKGRLLDDLVSNGIITLDTDGSIAQKSESPDSPLFAISKIAVEQQDALVRWTVDIPEEPVKDVWLDDKLASDWIEYVQSSETDTGLCYITGEIVPLAQNHPSRIRNSGDGAKIISSNDKSGYTYRGRFEDPQQAYGIGFTSTQKAHNALRWLISKQGYNLGNLCILTWNPNGHAVSNPADDFSSMFAFDDVNPKALTKEEAARHLNNRLRGYNSKVLDEDVMVLVLDSASSGKGRISIVTFRKELGKDLVSGLEHWHESCAWIHTYVKTKGEDGKDRKITFIGAPSPKDIARAAYGLKADDALVSHAIKRLLPCIIDGSTLPFDLVSSVVRRASMPQSMERWEWNKTLSIACSVYKQFTGGMYEMTLEKERKSRDYLYGRLLAVADLMEEAALKKAGEDRQTTAIRSMQRFSEFPYTTWKNIELALIPYSSRLGPELAGYYQRKIAEIMDLFDGDDFRSDKGLSGEFLLAYHCQRNDQFKKKETEEDGEVEE